MSTKGPNIHQRMVPLTSRAGCGGLPRKVLSHTTRRVVSDYARRKGAPTIPLNIARELAEVRATPVVMMLLRPEELASEFSRLRSLFVAYQYQVRSYRLELRPSARVATAEPTGLFG